MLKKIANKFPKFERYISSIIIIIFSLPPVFLIGFAGQVGSYIGLAILTCIGSYGFFEVVKNLKLSKISCILLALSLLVLILYPWTAIKDTAEIKNFNLSSLITHSFNWKNILFFIAVMLFIVVIDVNTWKENNFLKNSFITILTGLFAAFFAKGIWVICNHNWVWAFFFIAIPVISDTFGYFGGMLFGKKWFRGAKLAPKLSPKKTWAGFVIGYIFTALFIALAGWYSHIFKNTSSEIAFLVLSIIFIPIVAPMGDLLFSGIKRNLGIKDFSNLLPGHGGIFDRIDAAGAVIFAFIIMFIAFA